MANNIGKPCSKCGTPITRKTTRNHGLICKHCYNKYRREKYGMKPIKRTHCRECNQKLNKYNRVIFDGKNRNVCRECWNNSIRAKKGLDPVSYVYCKTCNRYLSEFHAKGGYCKTCRPKKSVEVKPKVKKAKATIKPKATPRPKKVKKIVEVPQEKIYVQKKQKTVIQPKVKPVKKTDEQMIQEWKKHNKVKQINQIYGV